MSDYNKPLTPEQQNFAEANHSIVYSFLRYKRLDGDYYDTVIFGYIRAVRNYFDRPDLRQYAFKTIAYKCMNSDLYNHYRKLYRQKRRAYVVSLDAPASDDGNMTLTDIISDGVGDSTADAVTGDIILSELFTVLPQEQLSVIRMKSEGYTDREIAKAHNLTVQSVQEILSAVRELVCSSLA